MGILDIALLHLAMAFAVTLTEQASGGMLQILGSMVYSLMLPY